MSIKRVSWFKALIAAAMISTILPAEVNYFCQGTIDNVSLNPSGVVTVVSSTSGLRVFYVCQIGTTMNAVNSEPCIDIRPIAGGEEQRQPGGLEL